MHNTEHPPEVNLGEYEGRDKYMSKTGDGDQEHDQDLRELPGTNFTWGKINSGS